MDLPNISLSELYQQQQLAASNPNSTFNIRNYMGGDVTVYMMDEDQHCEMSWTESVRQQEEKDARDFDQHQEDMAVVYFEAREAYLEELHRQQEE